VNGLATVLTIGANDDVVPLAEATRAFEKQHLRRALAATGGKRLKAAAKLGISRKSLWEKLRSYELEEANASRQTG
jgi:DNA-binding NtrC family response regulator